MFTLPQNTIAYLLKEPIDMRYGMFRRKHSTKTIVGRRAKIEAYVYIASEHHRLSAQGTLLKEPIDMRYGMFRLQGVIAQLMQQPMPRGAYDLRRP